MQLDYHRLKCKAFVTMEIAFILVSNDISSKSSQIDNLNTNLTSSSFGDVDAIANVPCRLLKTH